MHEIPNSPPDGTDPHAVESDQWSEVLLINTDNESGPADRVETFLAENAEAFAVIQKGWRDAEAMQSSLREMTDQYIFSSGLRARRRDRRNSEYRKIQQRGVGGYINNFTKQANAIAVEAYNETADLSNDAERLQIQETKLQANPLIDKLKKSIENPFLVPPQEQQNVISAFRNYTALVATTRFRDLLTGDRLKKFFEDSTVVQPFFARLKELAESPSQREFPGLLESVAAHIQQTEGKKMGQLLRDAFYNHPPNEAQDLRRFILTRLIETDNKNQQLEVASAMTRLLFNIEGEDTKNEVIERLIQRRRDWPDWLQNPFRQYTAKQVDSAWAEFCKTVRPFNRLSRGNKLIIDEVPYQEGATHKKDEPEPAALPVISTSVETAEREPISTFWALKSSGGSHNNNVLTYDTLPDLDAIMQLKSIEAYIKQHSGDHSLAPKIREALEILVLNPYHHPHTQKHVHTSFHIEGLRGKSFAVRRFSFKDFPGSGLVARQTRLFYAVVEVDNTTSLAIFGVKNKSETNRYHSKIPLT